MSIICKSALNNLHAKLSFRYKLVSQLNKLLAALILTRSHVATSKRNLSIFLLKVQLPSCLPLLSVLLYLNFT